jgi:tRNA-splicing endonuclease subunit Sen15
VIPISTLSETLKDDLYHVIPCSLSETLSFEWFVVEASLLLFDDLFIFFFWFARLQDAFKTLFPKEGMDLNVAAPPFLYVAITSSDSSIVYYKLSQGIVKPPA